nr:outer membrane protein assembly factor BamA [Methylocapsa aurea]
MRSHMSRFAVAALAFAWLIGGVAGAVAASVSVQGNKRIDSETIAAYFTGSDQAAVNTGVKDLYATGLFSEVKVRREGGRVVVVVAENNIINRVAFEGNSKIKTETLTAEVQSKSRGPYSQATVDADIERIKDAYRHAGRSAATVTARTVDLPNGRLDVVFTVDEGEKTGVKTINFVGNQVYSSGKLRDLMQTTEMNFMSFFKTSDVYDPDRIASDLELIRRYYLKTGYADFHVVGSDAQYDPAVGGYVITITVEEGVQYQVASVVVESHLRDIDGESLRPLVRLSAGDIYNGDMVEKTVDAMTKEIAKHGYAFSQVRPRGDRDPVSRTVTIAFVLDDGPRVYVERIVVRGNTRTRDYVIRREFELAEGDAYNRVLVSRAERRLNNLGYFKKVRITNEQGSAPDRVIIVVDVEDQATGALSVSGGYSTSAGFIAEVAVTETNFMGRGQYVRLAVSAGQYSRGVEFNFTEPYFLGNRMAAGFDVYAKQSRVNQYSYYNTNVTGATLRLGLPVTEEITFSPRYSIYNTDITIPNNSRYPYNDCNSPIWGTTPGIYNGTTLSFGNNCLTNGEASLALKQAQGGTLTSLIGYTLGYNSLDNNKVPTSGFFAELRQDVAGLGGDSHFVRTSADVRYYHEIYDQFVGFVRLQGGNITSFGGSDLRIVDNFNLGPSLVRGFAPNGIGPRDISDYYVTGNTQGNPLGGTTYFGASLEVQFPIFGMPRDLGLKGAVFADAGTLFGYNGPTNFTNFQNPTNQWSSNCTLSNVAPAYTQGNCIIVGGNSSLIRSSVGASIIWASPMGPIRFDFAKALTKSPFDQTQFFRFTGGTSF